jgi:hypothetical protein
MRHSRNAESVIPDALGGVVPADSRYVPLVQQAEYCAAPCCILMAMLRRRLPLLPQEVLAHHLGLALPGGEPAAERFFNARECAAGEEAGLKLSDPHFQPGAAFAALAVPLHFQFLPVSALDEEQFAGLLVQLTSNSSEEYDILFHLDRAVLNAGKQSAAAANRRGGARPADPLERLREHTLMHDKLIRVSTESVKIRVVDPAVDAPKWREVGAQRLLLAMQTLGEEELGGVWLIYSTAHDADSSDDPDQYDSPSRLQPPTSTPVLSRRPTPPLQAGAQASFDHRSVSVESSEPEHDIFVAQYASGEIMQSLLPRPYPANRTGSRDGRYVCVLIGR